MTSMARQASPRRPLHLETVDRAASRPHCLQSLPYALARLAAFGDIARTHSVRLVDTRRVHTRFRVRLATAGSARHRLPHFAILYCPFHCRRLCTCLRQCARHDRLHYLPHSPPLSRRGGSPPPGPPAPIPLRLNPWFVVPDRVPRLWFSHRTQRAAGVAQARACHARFSVSTTFAVKLLPDRADAPENRSYRIEKTGIFLRAIL